ncbi:MAG: excinuclease ABC subunit UvrC [Candidatus Aminicenantes bacterium]|nr:excinuclease ABC subunit UvrC [Candidatus Aminicenantes bacterium]
MLENKQDIPERPGIYIFKTAAGKILYIGKAINLKKRVSQYFQKKDQPLIRNLLGRAAILDFIVTDDEADALMLESDLVHGYQPPFNIRLKDDKSFPSIEITLGERFPGIYFSRQPQTDSFVLGPLVNAGKAKSLIDAVTRFFRLRSCANTLFKKGIPCLYYHIDRCWAPCAGKIKPVLYQQQVGFALDFLKGRKGKIKARLGVRMRRLAASLNFEEAQKIKEDLERMEKFSLRTYISSRAHGDFDVLATCLLGREAFFIHFAVAGGRVRQSDYFRLQTVHDDEGEAFREFMIDFYRHRPVPGEIIVSRLPVQSAGLEGLFSAQAGRRFTIRIARRGKKRQIVGMALKNLTLFVQKSDYRSLAERIKDMFRLRHLPFHIEAFDISHFGEKNRVGAMVVFRDGRSQKRLYRSYIIRSASAGDTEALKEVLSRRFRDEPSPPDLLLIDGGLPQLAASRQVKKKLGLRSDLLALAKGEERIFMEDGSSLVLEPGSLPRHLFQNIRDEVHRRAITHHRRRREKIQSGSGRKELA